MKKFQRVTETEVIAEFLRNEFYKAEFHHDRRRFERLVFEADLANEAENALRRALLFRLRGHMWRELPAGTQWWEVEVEESDLNLIRVFPRAQWRQVAQDDYLLRGIVERIRGQQYPSNVRDFIDKVQALSQRLRIEPISSCVLLIGRDEHSPFTILEGNHRLTAALLAGDGLMRARRFRVLAGLSPRMDECCWYQTTVANLWRYGKHRLKHLLYDKDSDVQRVLEEIGRGSAAGPLDETPVRKAIPGAK